MRARTEKIVRVPNNYEGLGLLAKNEMWQGVYLASALTRAENGVRVSSIIITKRDHKVELPLLTQKAWKGKVH